jgi:hypothetical protein
MASGRERHTEMEKEKAWEYRREREIERERETEVERMIEKNKSIRSVYFVSFLLHLIFSVWA